MLEIERCEGGWAALQDVMTRLAARPDIHGLLVLASENNGPVSDSFDAFVRQMDKPVLGGVFPALISEGERMEHGNVVLGFDVELDVRYIPSLSDSALDYDDLLADGLDRASPNPETLLVFVDGLAPRVGALIESLFNTYGLQGNFIGGGAGSLRTPGLRCIISNHGVQPDAAVIGVPRLSSRVCVSHGWQPLAGPFEVTHSENNVILSLDWEPALEVYTRAIASARGLQFGREDFGAVAASHPFGIARLNAEFVVRDPVAIREDGGLVCVGDVPRGSIVHIMHGDVQTLLQAARRVRTLIDQETPATVNGSGVELFMDCISRSLFLDQTISEELAAVRHPQRPQLGAFTLGEIANSKQDYLEFHNKTAVVATLWQGHENA